MSAGSRELSYVRDAGDHVAIGALTRHRDVETDDVLARECGVIRAVAAQVGDNQVRHRGTIGGSVAHGDPASDLPAALLALDATFVVQGPGGTREIAASEFFQGFLETALAPDELLCEIRVPKTGANGFAFEKFNRRAQDFATVGVVAARTNGGTHVGLINMGSTPLRAVAVEAGPHPRRLTRRRRRARRRRHRTRRRPQRIGRVPRAPRPRPRTTRTRGTLRPLLSSGITRRRCSQLRRSSSCSLRAMPCNSESRKVGISSSACMNAARDNETSERSPTAVTVASRGAGSNSDSSPK